MPKESAHEVAASTRKESARTRKRIAQECCNVLARDLELAYDGYELVDRFRSKGATPLDLSLVHPLRLARIKANERWAPPKGALNALSVLAMVLVHWRHRESEAHAGERYAGVLASNEQMAELAGCHPDTWARACRPWLEQLQLIEGLPTSPKSAPGWKSRTGARMSHREGRTLYVLGAAMHDLLDRRAKRIARNRAQLVGHVRRQLAKATGRPVPVLEDRKNPDPKAFDLEIKISRSNRARGRLPLVDANAKVKDRWRRSVRPAAARSPAPAAPHADARHVPCTSSSQTRQEPEGSKVTVREATPSAPERDAGGSSPPSTEAALVTTPAPVTKPATTADPTAVYQAKLRLLQLQLAGELDVSEVERQLAALDAGEVAPEKIGRRNAAGVTGAGGAIAPAPQATPRSPGGGAAAPRLGGALEAASNRLLGRAGPRFDDDGRSADERAENERRRQRAKRRAQREAERGGAPRPEGDDDGGRDAGDAGGEDEGGAP